MWFFNSPNIVYGEDALDFIENITGSKCFIISDENVQKLSYLKVLTDKLEKWGRNFDLFTEVEPDPKEEMVLKAKQSCLKYKPDLIIALGGGSVIDTAKGVWAMYEYPEFGIDDLHIFNSSLYELGKKAKLIAIPTTSGTGADATYAAVISRYNDGVWQKLIQAHRGLVPTYSILDPLFPMGMPLSLTIDTGMDVLAHAMEAMVANGRNEFSNALAIKAIELVFKYLPIVYKDGKNKEARDYLHQAATMAGLAFGNANVHIGHTTGHCLGAVFQTPHGRCVGLMLKYVTQYCLNNPNKYDPSIEIYAKLAKQLGWAKWEEDDKTASYLVIKKVKELNKELGFPEKIQDLGISKEDLDQNLDTLVNLCFQDASGSMCPRLPSKEDFKNIYRYAFEGKDIDF
ncbi:MAG: iron-containing alcohol dehydrogenase [Candidatus Lokiarchaeota archaeon]|nr:iron-containing alcohol dehydrogenase [Candidatus Lokiarchaeota archaeon]